MLTPNFTMIARCEGTDADGSDNNCEALLQVNKRSMQELAPMNTY